MIATSISTVTDDRESYSWGSFTIRRASPPPQRASQIGRRHRANLPGSAFPRTSFACFFWDISTRVRLSLLPANRACGGAGRHGDALLVGPERSIVTGFPPGLRGLLQSSPGSPGRPGRSPSSPPRPLPRRARKAQARDLHLLWHRELGKCFEEVILPLRGEHLFRFFTIPRFQRISCDTEMTLLCLPVPPPCPAPIPSPSRPRRDGGSPVERTQGSAGRIHWAGWHGFGESRAS